MKYEARYTAEALETLDELETQVRARIVKKIGGYCSASNPMAFAKPLTGPFKGLFRFRIGDYRAIFRKDPRGAITILFILTIKHRREVYES